MKWLTDSVVCCCTFRIEVQKEEDSDGGDTEDGNQHLEFDSARNSFSLALKGTLLEFQFKHFFFGLF